MIGRRPISRWNHTFGPKTLSGITHSFPWLSQTRRHVSTYYSPLRRFPPCGVHARLACLIHAANVHSEPGSNPSINCSQSALRLPWVAPKAHSQRVIELPKSLTVICDYRSRRKSFPAACLAQSMCRLNKRSLYQIVKDRTWNPAGSVPDGDSSFYKKFGSRQPALERFFIFVPVPVGLPTATSFTALDDRWFITANFFALGRFLVDR
jgi:hypothetical protein